MEIIVLVGIEGGVGPGEARAEGSQGEQREEAPAKGPREEHLGETRGDDDAGDEKEKEDGGDEGGRPGGPGVSRDAGPREEVTRYCVDSGDPQGREGEGATTGMEAVAEGCFREGDGAPGEGDEGGEKEEAREGRREDAEGRVGIFEEHEVRGGEG